MQEQSFQVSRTALDQAAQQILPRYRQSPLSFAERVQLTKHYHLANFPEILVSISHSRRYGAALVGSLEVNPQLQGIGIDLEYAARPLPATVIKRIQHPQDNLAKIPDRDDQGHPLPTALAFWCLKEACFKAVAASHPEIKLLSAIWINYPYFGSTLPEAQPANSPAPHLQGMCQVHLETTLPQALVLAQAALVLN